VEELRGRTLGIIGFGDIGRAAARLARAYGMRIAALRRGGAAATPDDPAAPCDEAVPPEHLAQLMGTSDYVLLATPLTPETVNIVDAAALAAMKRTGVFINLGRGPCVDEAALTACVAALLLRCCAAAAVQLR
jgi:phosphoglycerate dehydrogenase-like enzyme